MSIPLNAYIAIVETAESVTTGKRALASHRIDAAYYKADENGFTTFKDGSHKDIYTVRNDLLASIERIAVDTNALTVTIQGLIDAADGQGSSTGSYSRREELPDGRVSETGYEITVKAVCASVEDWSAAASVSA